MKNKKSIIVIVIALVILILGVVLIYYGVNKKSSLITKDTLFLCPEKYVKDNLSWEKLIKVKKDDNINEKDVCDGKFIGKYVCQDEYCDYSVGGQSWGGYIDYERGIAVIYDSNQETAFGHSFLYDFKNNKKLTDELGFSMMVYSNNNKNYFLVEKDEKSGIVDSNGKTIIDLVYLENNSRDILLANKGIIFLRLKDKLGIYDLEQEKLTTKMNLDKIGYYIYDGEYVRALLSELFSQVDNYNLNQIYVEENNTGKIINYKTGEVVKNLNKTYDFVLPLNDELILVSENNTTDILDNNFKSVLKEKINGVSNYNWDYDGGFKLEKDDFKNIIINIEDKDYIFNIETRELSEKQN